MSAVEPGVMRVTVDGPQVLVIVKAQNGDEMECRMDPQTGLTAAEAFMVCASHARANELRGN